ncbi:hypothetical protein JCM9279_001651 [Rhodotorula babjevae]
MLHLVLLFLLALLGAQVAQAGPLAYAACQACCSAGVVTCYGGAGFVFGTVTAGASTPAVILGCNSAFGACSSACAWMLLAPTP